MKKFYSLTKTLLVMALLCVGASNAWAGDVYTIVYGTPTYAGDGITVNGVTPQTDFTSDDGSTASDITHSDDNGTNCTNAMPIGGSVLYSNPSFSKSFETAATKGIVHFEANYTATTNGQETWKIVDSKGVEIFGTTDCGYSKSNATKIWGFCNGESLGTNWFRQPRGTHNRVVLDINFSTKKVAYTVLVSSGNNSYSTLTGTYDLPASVSDVKGLTATKQTYYSYMDNVSLYNVYDDAVTEYDYTINYKDGDDIVKTFSSSAAVDAVVTAASVIDGSEEGFVGKHYLIVAAEAPTMTITSGTNILNVPVRAPYTATLNVTKTIGGVAETPVVKEFTETDAKVCSWSYAWSLYAEKDSKFYLVDNVGSYVESGTFTDGDVINKTVAYTNEATDVVYFEDAIGKNATTGASGGYTGVWGGDNAKTQIGSISLDKGTYEVTFYVWAKAGSGTNHRGEQLDVNGTEVVSVTGNINGARVYNFAVEADASTIDIYGKGTNKATDEIDYVLIKKLPDNVSATITAAGWATYCSSCPLDFSGVSGLKAYIVTGTEGETATLALSEVTSVPANTGVLLEGAAKEYTIPVASSATNVSANKLIGVTTETKKAAETIYVLMDETAGVGFYKNNKDFTVGANTAYLPADFAGASEARSAYFFDSVTGVEAVKAAAEAAQKDGKFVINGQLVIQKNGKKFNAAGQLIY